MKEARKKQIKSLAPSPRSSSTGKSLIPNTSTKLALTYKRQNFMINLRGQQFHCESAFTRTDRVGQNRDERNKKALCSEAAGGGETCS
ncbi:hypothetical protein E2C01_005376 [Portunus trituberculatus]|uniref:Uncharacterized protein n=1 Tax=Portunus trituberculatus TaxID=210409 RepID=A0A5B7CUZ7_PORTR|nr:hypothetical protein [Portunus trituberculatus]